MRYPALLLFFALSLAGQDRDCVAANGALQRLA